MSRAALDQTRLGHLGIECGDARHLIEAGA
ncbi:MAG: hypothetical protein GAK40_00703 [Burkholderia plantarii]|nr:MAG: hypothetical protein GAK40_00703 [Burkholderia plantarii]